METRLQKQRTCCRKDRVPRNMHVRRWLCREDLDCLASEGLGGFEKRLGSGHPSIQRRCAGWPLQPCDLRGAKTPRPVNHAVELSAGRVGVRCDISIPAVIGCHQRVMSLPELSWSEVLVGLEALRKVGLVEEA